MQPNKQNIERQANARLIASEEAAKDFCLRFNVNPDVFLSPLTKAFESAIEKATEREFVNCPRCTYYFNATIPRAATSEQGADSFAQELYQGIRPAYDAGWSPVRLTEWIASKVRERESRAAHASEASAKQVEKINSSADCPFCGLKLLLRVFRNTVPLIHCNGCGCEVAEGWWQQWESRVAHASEPAGGGRGDVHGTAQWEGKLGCS